jgi:hypothetical protein
MNNPFSRLKHFIPDENDPQENHATECLAACLVFSSTLRRAFIDFLFDGGEKVEVGDESKVEVETQRPIEQGGYIDLVLEQPQKVTVVVEVKVKSPENCDHHREQIARYRKWLRTDKKADGYLFTLVRNPDDAFRPERYGADGRRSWSELFKSFRKNVDEGTLSEVEVSLVKNLCEYLESEGIVSTYETKDLLRYSDGLKAKKAVAGIFNQVASRLKPDGFESVSDEDRKDWWPVLKIEHPDWKKIFGKGRNQKISVWFMVPGVWEADKHDFGLEIELWNKEHGNDWRIAKPKLTKWLSKLKSQKFDWDIYQTWKKPQRNIPANKIELEPRRIIVSKNWGEPGEAILDQDSPQSEDELVNLLVKRSKELASTVSSLDS